MNIGVQYMENLFAQFVAVGSDIFYHDVLQRARVKMSNCHGVDLELLHLSHAALERARFLEQQTGGSRLEDWRNLAALLRRAAHKINRECPVKSDHPAFLRLIQGS